MLRTCFITLTALFTAAPAAAEIIVSCPHDDHGCAGGEALGRMEADEAYYDEREAEGNGVEELDFEERVHDARSYWKHIPGCLTDYAPIDNQGGSVGIGCGRVGPGGNQIFYGPYADAWSLTDGLAVKAAVARDGQAWVLAENGQIFYRKRHGVPHDPSHFTWETTPGCAMDIAVADDGRAWVLGCTWEGEGGYGIYYNHGVPGGAFSRIPGEATHIAAESSGTPWVVDHFGTIWRMASGSWQPVDGCARDIAVANGGEAWVLGCAQTPAGGLEIYRRTPIGWVLVPGAARSIHVTANGLAYFIDPLGRLFKHRARYQYGAPLW